MFDAQALPAGSYLLGEISDVPCRGNAHHVVCFFSSSALQTMFFFAACFLERRRSREQRIRANR